MAGDPRVQELLEELLESGNTPEEVCRHSPELLSEVLERWHRLHACDAQLDAWFPQPGSSSPVRNPGLVEPGADLPQIPGYEVKELLGRGGMGVVFRARHLRLNRIVALKMALAGAFAGPHERERFQREAEAVAGLRHPNVVQIHDVGDADGRPYYTMEFVEGGSLAQKLAGTPQPASQGAALLATLAAAVHAAHQGGIVHRDLKPANVLLTADGMPKISDFGLARRFAGEAGLTRTGTAVGTPSYMPPEQARGKPLSVGPAVDIYALGAILYELLTGRPPFRAETAAETVQQVISQEPVPPSRLNAKVPRDLETICLKCLRKEPERRYATAAALADDLHRFQRGEPIAARPVGRPERLMTWIRRNPTAAALLFTAPALLGLAVVAGMREWAVAAERRQEMARWSDRLAFAIKLQQEGRFAEARAILREADAGNDDLRQQIEQARAHLDLVERLDALRLSRGSLVRDYGIDYAESSRRYEAIIREAGLGEYQEDPDRVAERLDASPIRKALIAALDDWAACADKKERDWVLRVARRMDPEPWRDRIRDLDSWAKMESFPDLAATANVREQPVTLMVAFGTRWRRLGGDPAAFLENVQRRYPNDFWVNFELGHLFRDRDTATAIGYLRAALAVRPDAAVVHRELGTLFAHLGHIDDAIHHHKRNVEVAPTDAGGHVNLGSALADKGRLNEAIDHWRKVPAADPEFSKVRGEIRGSLIKLGRGEEAWVEWRELLEGSSKVDGDWDGYAELCLFLGHEDEYRRACRELLTRFDSATDPHVLERTGRACLLLPAAEQQLRKAAGLIDRALAADKSTYEGWAYPYFLIAKGLAEYRLNRLESAIAILKWQASGGVLGPAPKLVLAMTQYRRGEREEARHILALAVLDFDWSIENAASREAWIYHALRREAERLILPDLPAFLDGMYQPRDNDERLALLGVCQFANRTRASARLYAAALAADPRLAEDLGARHRYNAARVAALAGCGRGVDAVGLGEPERTQWRRQARQWLRADLAAWGKARGGDPSAARERVRETLTHWRGDPDLAGLREPGETGRLSALERADCLALWDEVGDMLVRNGGVR